MIAQTPAAAEIEKWLQIRFFKNFWHRIRKKNIILLESTPALRISGHLCCLHVWPFLRAGQANGPLGFEFFRLCHSHFTFALRWDLPSGDGRYFHTQVLSPLCTPTLFFSVIKNEPRLVETFTCSKHSKTPQSFCYSCTVLFQFHVCCFEINHLLAVSGSLRILWSVKGNRATDAYARLTFSCCGNKHWEITILDLEATGKKAWVRRLTVILSVAPWRVSPQRQ